MPIEPKTCYMCDNPATSREHVPPDCFFPKGHKSNLITVPSCVNHNLKKSKDDEYVRFFVAMHISNNRYGVDMAVTKGLRSVERSDTFLARVFHKAFPIKMPDGSITAGAEVDLARWDNYFYQFANAIFFHDHGRCHKGAWELVNYSLFCGESLLSNEPDPYNEIRTKLQSLNFIERPSSNPEIFRYYFFKHSEDSYAYKFLFYEGFAQYVISVKGNDAAE
jgi:hypothetical protein